MWANCPFLQTTALVPLILEMRTGSYPSAALQKMSGALTEMGSRASSIFRLVGFTLSGVL